MDLEEEDNVSWRSSAPTFPEKVTLEQRQEGGGSVSHGLRTREKVPGGVGWERHGRG